MAKSKKKPAKRMRVRKPRQQLLDSAAQAYANLLRDPCNAALVPPIYPGGGAGFLFRGETFFSVGNGATETAGYLHWTPGYVNSSNSDLIVAATTTSNGVATNSASGNGPAKAFLNSNVRGARCIAACLRITYPGAESGRSGRVHYGHSAGGAIDVGDSITPDGVAQLLVNYGRTPADTIELYWKPDVADFEFNDPSAASSATLKDRKSSLTVAWAGLPATVGLTFHLTAVYEWQPTVSLGIGMNTKGKAVSKNTIDEVIDYVNRTFDWVKSAADHIDERAVLSSALAFGVMPAVRRRRAVLNIAA